LELATTLGAPKERFETLKGLTLSGSHLIVQLLNCSTQGCRLCSNLGLKLANAFGVIFSPANKEQQNE
jgi:hypothetical protein